MQKLNTRDDDCMRGEKTSTKSPFFLLPLLLNILAYPNKTVFDALAGHGRTSLNVPATVSDRVQIESFGDLARSGRVYQVLLIRKYENRHSHELLFGQQLRQLFAGLVKTFPIATIDNIYLRTTRIIRRKEKYTCYYPKHLQVHRYSRNSFSNRVLFYAGHRCPKHLTWSPLIVRF